MENIALKYNFDQVTERSNSDSLKWNVEPGELPMWVADMDFPTAPCILEALKAKVEHGIFGYTLLADEWYSSIQNWWQTRHNLTISKEWILFCHGVVPAISSLIRRLTHPGENVLIQTPVYNCFFRTINDNGRNVLENCLRYADGEYFIDWNDLEEKLSDPQTTLMLLCNPHNPIGKIWDKQTLVRISKLCSDYHVVVVADEIHCDLTDPGVDYVPFASVSEAAQKNSITCISPTKTFNIAGIQTSALVIPDEFLRNRVHQGLRCDELSENNVFAGISSAAAFSQEGAERLDELRDYIYGNKKRVGEFLQAELPQVKLVPSQATYLLWLDCCSFCHDFELADFIRQDSGLFLTDGTVYGGAGLGFLRLNIACPRSVLEDGLKRLKKSVLNYINA